MSSAWYYEAGGRQLGPLDDDMMKELIRGRDIRATNLIWREGMANWLPCSEVPELAGLLPPTRVAPPAPELAAAATMPAQPPPLAAPVVPAAAPVQYNAWTPLAEQNAPAAPAAAGGPSHFCAVCGQSFGESDMIHYMGSWICAACKPAFFQRMREGAGGSGGFGTARYAGFWIRWVAKIIDGIVLGIPAAIIFFIFIFGGIGLAAAGGHSNNPMMAMLPNLFGIFFQIGFVAINAFYSGFMLSRYGATLGKMAMGLRVVTLDGQHPSFGRALGRGFAEGISRAICSIGYIIAAFDEQKRTLHDHICSTRVVYK